MKDAAYYAAKAERLAEMAAVSMGASAWQTVKARTDLAMVYAHLARTAAAYGRAGDGKP